MTLVRCRVCTRPVESGRPHGGCAPYLAIAGAAPARPSLEENLATFRAKHLATRGKSRP